MQKLETSSAEEPVAYDSTEETRAHIARVSVLLFRAVVNLDLRSQHHDESKLLEPEKSGFDRVTGKLRGMTYGSDEYKAALTELGPVLDHHYAHNSHHPEHYGYKECDLCFARHPIDWNEQCRECRNGSFTFRSDIAGMSLMDLIEMLCDWKAAGERHADGSMRRSLDLNQVRFNIPWPLQRILENTARELGFLGEVVSESDRPPIRTLESQREELDSDSLEEKRRNAISSGELEREMACLFEEWWNKDDTPWMHANKDGARLLFTIAFLAGRESQRKLQNKP